jgi:hypothetical protein
MVKRKGFMKFPVTRMIAKMVVGTVGDTNQTLFFRSIPQAIDLLVREETPARR